MHAENLGIAAKLYEKHTATYFTEAFGNVMYNGSKSESKYQKINSFMFEWNAAPYNGDIIRINTLIAGSLLGNQQRNSVRVRSTTRRKS